MSRTKIRTPLDAVREKSVPLSGEARDYDVLLAMAANKSFVLLGEASHGTHEFYRVRAAVTRRLIEERDFDAVLAEADWPDMYRVNRFVRGRSIDADAATALGDFTRFPRWMWRNRDMLDFVAWLRAHNANRSPQTQAGLYGLDLYSLHRSAAAVIGYLDKIDPDAAQRARERYACMDHADAQGYGLAVAMGVRESCEDEVVAQLREMLNARAELVARDGVPAEDAQFCAETNARVARSAEAYYRGMFSSRANTWNLRDRHMADTLFALHEHLSRQRGRPARIAVWAHNSHLGDARATDAARRGELNLGQLARERAPRETLLVGFTTCTGHVTAARDWGAPAEHRWVRPALEGSVERLFARTGLGRFFLPIADDDTLPRRALERAIGVIYRPESERQSHYFNVSFAGQFDAVFHLDETTALEPLDIGVEWQRREEAPETWPSGI